MIAQKIELIELVEKNGWKATQLDNYAFQKCSMETWLLESVWTPTEAKAYVSFLIDPMSDFQNPYPWAIEVRKDVPVYGTRADYFEIPLKQWKNEKDNFLQFLSKIRHDSRQNLIR